MAVFVVIGASGGIGNHLFHALKNDGQVVFGTFNKHSDGVGESIEYAHLNVTDSNSINKWIAEREPYLKNIVLINCVGINYNCLAHKADLNQWHQVIDVNLNGAFNLIRLFLPIMRSQKFGRLIQFSSVVPKIGVKGTSAYSASKSALWGLSRALVKECAPFGITINNINLGYFNAGMINDIPPDLLDEILGTIPAGRLGELNEVVEIVRTLVNVEYLNGANIDLNGGL